MTEKGLCARYAVRRAVALASAATGRGAGGPALGAPRHRGLGSRRTQAFRPSLLDLGQADLAGAIQDAETIEQP